MDESSNTYDERAFVYSNVVHVRWTLTDLCIKFGEVETSTYILDKVSVTLPWFQAKVLMHLLRDVIQAYEKENGELVKPKLAVLPEEPK